MARRRRKRSQYHHYIPRFILRKWIPDEESIPALYTKVTPIRTRPHRDSDNADAECINTYDVGRDVLTLNGTPVADVYGFEDLYKDPSHADDVYHIETLFRGLEFHASRILTKLDDALSSGASTIDLHRTQLDKLQKFLSIMPFRSLSRSRQFINGESDLGMLDEIEAFMEEYTLPDAHSAWLFSLKNILLSGPRSIASDEGILKSIRKEYAKHHGDNTLWHFCLAPEDCEFILTDTGFGVTGDWEQVKLPSGVSWWRIKHFPISPKLLISSRTYVPSPLNAEIDIGPKTAAGVRIRWKGRHVLRDIWRMGDMPNGEPIRGNMMRFEIHQLTRWGTEKINRLVMDNNPQLITFKTPSTFSCTLDFISSPAEMVKRLKHRLQAAGVKDSAIASQIAPSNPAPSPYHAMEQIHSLEDMEYVRPERTDIQARPDTGEVRREQGYLRPRSLDNPTPPASVPDTIPTYTPPLPYPTTERWEQVQTLEYNKCHCPECMMAINMAGRERNYPESYPIDNARRQSWNNDPDPSSSTWWTVLVSRVKMTLTNPLTWRYIIRKLFTVGKILVYLKFSGLYPYARQGVSCVIVSILGLFVKH